jgi:hypothetical protein
MELDDYTCVLCNAGYEEMNYHLFFECDFIQVCWDTIPINWNLNLSPLDMVIVARSNFGNPIFREIFIIACWVIWTTRNAIIFDNEQVDHSKWKRLFKQELGLVCTKAKPAIVSTLNVWRDSYQL